MGNRRDFIKTSAGVGAGAALVILGRGIDLSAAAVAAAIRARRMRFMSFSIKYVSGSAGRHVSLWKRKWHGRQRPPVPQVTPLKER